MALFGKQDNINSLLKRIESRSYKGISELREILDRIDEEFGGVELKQAPWMLAHPDPMVRDRMIKQVSEAPGDKATVRIILQVAPGQSPALRRDLCNLALTVDRDAARGELSHLVYSNRVEDREVAFEVIGADPDWEISIPYLKAGLKDPEPSIRTRAARTLARGANHTTVFFILREKVHDDDPDIRSIAIHALAGTGNPEIAEPFFERLLDESGAERTVMIKALSELARDPKNHLIDRVVPFLANEDEDNRDVAVRLLREMPNRTEVLRRFLYHVRGLAHWLRDRCIESIWKVSDDLVEPLIELMQGDDANLRVDAMNLAGRSKDPKILPAVQGLFLSDMDWWIRNMAADVLANFPQPQIVDLLASRLQDPDLRYGMIHSLGRMDTPQVMPHLLACLNDPARGIRLAVLDALADRDDPLVVDSITQVGLKDPEPSVREKAAVILAEHGTRGQAGLKQIEESRSQRTEDTGPPIELRMENEALNKPSP